MDTEDTRIVKILLATMPQEGEVIDRVTPQFYKNSVVKYMPLGLLSVAANIDSEHELSVLDASSRGLTIEETVDEIETWQPDVLGLSVVTYRAWAMTELLRKTSATLKIVGGPHTTYNSNHVVEQGANAVFIGDAECTFPQWLDDGCPEGIFVGEQVDLNTIPIPARHLLDLRDYEVEPDPNLLFDVGRFRLPMYSSKGCPRQCNYCDVQQKIYNYKSPYKCFAEFCLLSGMGATSIHILDDAFNIRKQRVISIAELIQAAEINIDWSVRGTVEVRAEVMESLGAAGCKRFHVGIEHLDDAVLQYFRKSQRRTHIERFCRLCHEVDIAILGYFMIGAPFETEEYRLRLPQMVRDLGIEIPYFNILSPLYGTPYYQELMASGMIAGDPWGDFCLNPTRDFVMPSGRTYQEDLELQATIDEYIAEFRR